MPFLIVSCLKCFMSEVFHEGVQVMRQWDDESTDRLTPTPLLYELYLSTFLCMLSSVHLTPSTQGRRCAIDAAKGDAGGAMRGHWFVRLKVGRR